MTGLYEQSLESYNILGSIPNSAGTMMLWLSFFFVNHLTHRTGLPYYRIIPQELEHASQAALAKSFTPSLESKYEYGGVVRYVVL